MRPSSSIAKFAALAAIVAGLSACSPQLNEARIANVTPAAPADGSYRLGGGDKISVTIFGDNSISGEYAVDPDGSIALPLVGRVPVAGRTPAETEAAVADAVKNGIVEDPRVSVAVVQYRPFYVVGEVARPGAYAFYNGFTVLNALALAGGQTYRADLRNISIIRQANGNGDATPAKSVASIEPGDVIIVPERHF